MLTILDWLFAKFYINCIWAITWSSISLLDKQKITNAQDNQKQKEQKLRLENALKIIRQTLTENNARLQITVATINSGKVQFDIQLDISAWDAVKDDIAEHLHDPNLKKRIAYHFSRLNTMAKLNGMYLDFSAGIGAALGGVETTRDALKSNLLATAGFLSTDIAEILPLIDAKLTNKWEPLPITAPTQKAGFRIPKTVLWLLRV